MSDIIVPTPGRIVYFYPAPNENIPVPAGKHLSAQIAAVHDDRRVNLSVLDSYGNHHARQNVTLVQPNDANRPVGSHATWMPYQIDAAGIEVKEVAEQAQEAAPVIGSEPTGDTTADTDAVGTVAGEGASVTTDTTAAE
jgi:hypothetical protein